MDSSTEILDLLSLLGKHAAKLAIFAQQCGVRTAIVVLIKLGQVYDIICIAGVAAADAEAAGDAMPEEAAPAESGSE